MADLMADLQHPNHRTPQTRVGAAPVQRPDGMSEERFQYIRFECLYENAQRGQMQGTDMFAAVCGDGSEPEAAKNHGNHFVPYILGLPRDKVNDTLLAMVGTQFFVVTNPKTATLLAPLAQAGGTTGKVQIHVLGSKPGKKTAKHFGTVAAAMKAHSHQHQQNVAVYMTDHVDGPFWAAWDKALEAVCPPVQPVDLHSPAADA
eukprot:m.120902 g.120902  ORF g.120902 m.120902 type:complete len:203 (-) comp16518_c0_seq3:233-841(-)